MCLVDGYIFFFALILLKEPLQWWQGAVDQSKMLLRSSSEQWKAEIENLIQKDSSEKKTEETIEETSEKKMAPQPGDRTCMPTVHRGNITMKEKNSR
jgi:Flp pilus assembly protein TadB